MAAKKPKRNEQRYQDAWRKNSRRRRRVRKRGFGERSHTHVEPFLPAQGEDGGLNLPWGDYDVTVEYDSPADMELRAVSAGRQTFIQNGAWRLAAGEEKAVCRFTLTDSTSGLLIAGDPAEGAEIRSITVHKVGAGIFSADLAAYAALLGAVLTVLLVLSWDTSARAHAQTGCADGAWRGGVFLHAAALGRRV